MVKAVWGMPGASSCPHSPGQHLIHSPNPGPLGSQNTACCPANWLEHEGHCYWFSSLRKPWPEAEKDCQLKNAQLVVINSRDEQVSPSSSGPKTGLVGIIWGVLTTLQSEPDPQRFHWFQHWDQHSEFPPWL